MSSHLSGSYEELSTQAQQYVRNSQYDEAREIYERIYNRLGKMKQDTIDKRPRLKELKVLSMRMLGDIAGFQSNYDDALKYYQDGLANDPEQQLEYQRAIAQTKIDMGDTSAGLDELRALVIANTGKPQPWLWLGIELWSQGNNAEAIENLERATEMMGEDASIQSTAFSYLHDVYREENRLEDAEEAWKNAWHIQGGDIGDVSPLYQMHFEAGNMEKAREWLKQEKNPLRSGFYRGLFAQSENQENKAQSAWRKTAQLNPTEQQDGHEAWAEAALRVDHPADHVAYVLREITSRNLINIRGTVLLAAAFARLEQTDAVDVALQGALDINQRARPRRDKLSFAHWELFDELVSDSEIKDDVRDLFEDEAPKAEGETEPAGASDANESTSTDDSMSDSDQTETEAPDSENEVSNAEETEAASE